MVVVFVDVDEDSFYVGGEANIRFVRLVTQHLARENTDRDRAEMVVNKLQDALAPYVCDCGLDWETHVEMDGSRRVEGERSATSHAQHGRREAVEGVGQARSVLKVFYPLWVSCLDCCCTLCVIYNLLLVASIYGQEVTPYN